MQLAVREDQLRIGSPQKPERLDDLWAELRARVLLDLGECREQRTRRPVRPVAGERVERVGHEDDSGRQWNLLAGEPVGISGSVDALVARAGALSYDRVEVELREDVVGGQGMRLDDCPFRLVQRASLAENLLGDA